MPDDMPARPCPGLAGDLAACKNEKEPGGGYCTDCRKRYQRVRYRAQKGTPTGGTRSYRRSKLSPAEEAQTYCGSCGARTDELGHVVTSTMTPSGEVTRGLPTPEICRPCFEVFETLTSTYRPEVVRAVAKFIVAHSDILGIKAREERHENIMRILFARWYDEEIEFQRDFAPPGQEPALPKVHQFKPSAEQYMEVARRMSSSAVLGQTEHAFEVLNARGPLERTKYYASATPELDPLVAKIAQEYEQKALPQRTSLVEN